MRAIRNEVESPGNIPRWGALRHLSKKARIDLRFTITQQLKNVGKTVDIHRPRGYTAKRVRI